MTPPLPSRITFATCLFAAPVVFGMLVWALGLGGDYAKRFAQVGALGLLISLPVWFTAFAWLAWRTAKRDGAETKHYVFASLGANVASLIVYPAIIGITVATGDFSRAIGSVPNQLEAPPSPLQAAVLAGGAAFFMGLFFLPMLAALFGWVAKMLRLGGEASAR